jgi:hypothetical protein
MSGERSTTAMLMDHIPLCQCSWYVGPLHDRVVHVLEEFMLEAGATKGRDLRLGVLSFRSGASRDRHGDVVWLDVMAPHRHLFIDMTVIQMLARTSMFLVYVLVAHSRAVLYLELSMANSMWTSALLLCLTRLRFSRSITTIPSPWRMRAGWRLWRPSWLIG